MAHSFGPAAQINRLTICAPDALVATCIGALRLIGIRRYATAKLYLVAEAVAEAVADARSVRAMVSNTRLRMNIAAIEKIVEERL